MRRFHDENGFLILANALVLRTMKPLQESVVKKALEFLAERHPMLRMCIRKNNDGDYCFQKRHNVLVDLRQLDTSNWRNVMEESLLEKFDVENGPLWRLTFLPNARYETETGSDVNDTSFPHECICIFCFHHSIIDGTSYSRLFAEFVHHLNKLNKNEEPKVTTMPMLPPCDVYVDEVNQIKWYHIAMKLAVKLLCFIPGLPKFIRIAMGEKENAFSRKKKWHGDPKKSSDSTKNQDYSHRVYKGRNDNFSEALQRVADHGARSRSNGSKCSNGRYDGGTRV